MLPFAYTFRSLFVRKSATLLTMIGIAATVTALAGVLSLRSGFERLFTQAGSDDVVYFLRPGAQSEGESYFRRDMADRLIKTLPEIAATGESGVPIAAMECFLAVRRLKAGGTGKGETNVPIRGVGEASFTLRADRLSIVEGSRFTFGADEVIVGRKLVDRIQDCRVGDFLKLNTTPFKVVGVFACEGPNESEIWGDYERMSRALERPNPNVVIARLKEGVDPVALSERIEKDKECPAKVMTERAYLGTQTAALSTVLLVLSIALSVIMGTAAVFTATNTMLSAVAGRTHEIGILLSIGFRPVPIFCGFLCESVLIGLSGGALGCLLALPLNGIETGTTNFQTFTEVAFAFRVTPDVLGSAVGFSLLLGLLGGAVPAWRAARMQPTEALRRR